MAAMSSAFGTTTMTSPSNSYDDESTWRSYATAPGEDSIPDGAFTNHREEVPRSPLSAHHGNAHNEPSAPLDAAESPPATKEVRSGGRTTTRPDNKRTNSNSSEPVGVDERNKWIHRDKLARIESEELQAAGIVLPKPRSQSRPRRDRSTEKSNGRRGTNASDQEPLPKSRKNSTHRSMSAERSPDQDSAGWDLRLPEEIREDPDEYWISADTLAPNATKIPVAKASPVPIPTNYLDRDAPVARKMSGTIMPDEDFMLSVGKARSRSGSTAALEQASASQSTKRSATDGSPKKNSQNGARKASTPLSKPAATGATGRPKTRSGSGKDGNTTRPTTRSGELTSPKAPEGDPPWMVSAYKPDPRLPPDQQLLPTVARRLQQEKWEKEGKFGNVYDKEFRPLTDEGFTEPPELQKPDDDGKHDEWPLRADAKSPTPSRPGTSSYSTMPKIQDTPLTPLASPRSPLAPPLPAQVAAVSSESEQPQEAEKEQKKKKSGCGCCIVM